jgi:hypothetical protein
MASCNEKPFMFIAIFMKISNPNLDNACPGLVEAICDLANNSRHDCHCT